MASYNSNRSHTIYHAQKTFLDSIMYIHSLDSDGAPYTIFREEKLLDAPKMEWKQG